MSAWQNQPSVAQLSNHSLPGADALFDPIGAGVFGHRSGCSAWNNEWRYKRLSEMPDPIQEFMEEYIPQFVPLELRHHIDYFFDIYDAEEKGIRL